MQILNKIGEDRMNIVRIRAEQHAECWKCTKWPYDLVFNITWPIFETGLYIIQIQLLTKIGEDQMNTV